MCAIALEEAGLLVKVGVWEPKCCGGRNFGGFGEERSENGAEFKRRREKEKKRKGAVQLYAGEWHTVESLRLIKFCNKIRLRSISRYPEKIVKIFSHACTGVFTPDN